MFVFNKLFKQHMNIFLIYLHCATCNVGSKKIYLYFIQNVTFSDTSEKQIYTHNWEGNTKV